ncbi:hypothetical protein [Actinomyces lilanjuaniae]|nr:hypothetical protein [Actinomyces lilanjuaniae]
MTVTAYGDESIRRTGVPESMYLLGAYLHDDALPDPISPLKKLARGPKLHWRDSVPHVRKEACRVIGSSSARHLIVLASPLVHGAHEEQARQQALMTLVTILACDYDVGRLVLEHRQRKQDDKDQATVAIARQSGMISTRFSLQHAYGDEEPHLWVPDQVLGAYGDARTGKTTNWNLLAASVRLETIQPTR